MIYYEKVSKVYGPQSTALEDVTFSLKRGEFLSIVGHSGAGKTTLLKLLLAEEAPSSGSVFFESVKVHELHRRSVPLLRRKIGTIFQDFKLLAQKTAYENVAFAMEVCGHRKEKIAKDVPKILELVGLLHKKNSFPDEMSGGEKQRVAIARSLAHRPVLLLADEPTGNLDDVNANEVLELLLKINALGTTVILATHASDLVNKVKKRVITIENGHITLEQKEGQYKL
jgi:cell division transport system ATP-binding protein